jgi:hypothetical protein
VYIKIPKLIAFREHDEKFGFERWTHNQLNKTASPGFNSIDIGVIFGKLFSIFISKKVSPDSFFILL